MTIILIFIVNFALSRQKLAEIQRYSGKTNESKIESIPVQPKFKKYEKKKKKNAKKL